MRRSLRKLPQAKDRAAVRLATGNVGLYRLGYRTMSAPPSSTGRRRCSMCRKFKPLSDFPVKNKARGTLRSYCRDCCRVYAKRHYQRNRATYLRRTRGRHDADRAACRALAYEHLATHPASTAAKPNYQSLTLTTVTDPRRARPSMSSSVEVTSLGCGRRWKSAMCAARTIIGARPHETLVTPAGWHRTT